MASQAIQRLAASSLIMATILSVARMDVNGTRNATSLVKDIFPKMLETVVLSLYTYQVKQCGFKAIRLSRARLPGSFQLP